jgi:serine/threonine protein kinase/tetratricopeptide (TPR) repeat protein
MSGNVGPYRIVRQIGRGGMGIVFEAVDERLQRSVALKTIQPASDPQMRDRFLREARAAAAVSHPHICPLHEIGEHEGSPFIVMELLEGESLAARLERGAIPPPEAIGLSLAILSALGALHARGIIHRDLKPSNVFLSVHGVKLLDFGLARPVSLDADATSLTLPGVLLGTPRYMSPEQARGSDVDFRADIFTAGALLFEMLSGRPAFNGSSAIELLHSVINEQPPALVGSLAVVEIDRVIQRALAKSPADRYQSADEMAQDLRACLSREDVGSGIVARATTRLVVLPFKLLRPDPAIDFLAFSLPDAITVSLTGLGSLVVRSSMTAAKFSADQPDLRVIATDANVDAIVTGSLLHAGGQLRVSVQLIEVPSGTVRWSHALQAPLDDLFSIQDSICSEVVAALAVPLSNRDQRQLRQDVPANPEAFANYLHANRLSESSAQWTTAREMYQRAVEADPSYAPAWARLGRCLRVMGKYSAEGDGEAYLAQAEEAFQRAFKINPELSLAHNLYTYAEVDTGRALQAVVRLLGRVRERTSEPDLYAGLVHACRYAGLLNASIAAYERARRLDPAIRTSVAHTYFMNGQYGRAIETDIDSPPYVTVMSLMAMGRTDEAASLCHSATARMSGNDHLRLVLDAGLGILEKRLEDGRAALAKLIQLPTFSDPEGWYYWAQAATQLKDESGALDLLARAVNAGLSSVRGLETTPLLDGLRTFPQFNEIVGRARTGQSIATRAFTDADGHRLLGLPLA